MITDVLHWQLEELGVVIVNADDVVDDAYRNGAPNLVDILRMANQTTLVILLLMYGPSHFGNFMHSDDIQHG